MPNLGAQLNLSHAAEPLYGAAAALSHLPLGQTSDSINRRRQQ